VELTKCPGDLRNGVLGSARHRCDGVVCRVLQMPKYKMYILIDDDHVITRANLYCDGVQQARELAKALVDGKPVELWKGLIRIERFDPTH
jgi:hypothetical protein